jgi:hypothetical protein
LFLICLSVKLLLMSAILSSLLFYKLGMRSWKSGLKSKRHKSKTIAYCYLSYFCYQIFIFFSNVAHLYL